MRSVTAVCVLFALELFFAPRVAALSNVPRDAALRPVDLARSVFDRSAPGVGAAAIRPIETLRLEGSRIDMPTVHFSVDSRGYAPQAGAPGISGRKAALAVASSALLPGLGEFILYWDSRDPWTLARVPVFFALEGYFWYGYRDNYDTGKDFKRQYEAYADAHWDLDRFLLQHPCCDALGGCDSWQEYNEYCQGMFNYFLFTPKEVDREEYYENVGKYNAFAYGWDDWTNPTDYPDFWTPHRKYYWSLRGESDKYLLRSDQFIMALIVNRVVSVIDTGWLAYRMSKGGSPGEGWSLRLKTFDTAPCLVLSRGF